MSTDNTRQVAAEEPLEGGGGGWEAGGACRTGENISAHRHTLRDSSGLPERDSNLAEHRSSSKVLQRPLLILNWKWNREG